VEKFQYTHVVSISFGKFDQIGVSSINRDKVLRAGPFMDSRVSCDKYLRRSISVPAPIGRFLFLISTGIQKEGSLEYLHGRGHLGFKN
jgi:hypothetical protein